MPITFTPGITMTPGFTVAPQSSVPVEYLVAAAWDGLRAQQGQADQEL